MTSGSSPATPRSRALADELTRARRRGLADLDLTTSNQGPVATPELDGLATRHARDNQQTSRSARITELLREGLAAFENTGNRAEAAFIRRLFFDSTGLAPGPSRPADLLDRARKASGLDEDGFSKRRHLYFEHFAAFLIPFVEEVAQVPQKRGDDARRSWRLGLGVITVLAVIAVIVILTRKTDDNPSGNRGTTAVTPPRTSPVTTLTFDSLGSRSSDIIYVYPGVTTATADRRPNGTFRNGDKVKALCILTGRRISSDTSAGEQERSSDQWVLIDGSPGIKQYATLTYAKIESGASHLPNCAVDS